MKRIHIVFLVAGVLVSVSAMLGFGVSRNWLFLTLFVGLNMTQYAFSGFCPLLSILERLHIGDDG